MTGEKIAEQIYRSRGMFKEANYKMEIWPVPDCDNYEFFLINFILAKDRFPELLIMKKDESWLYLASLKEKSMMQILKEVDDPELKVMVDKIK